MKPIFKLMSAAVGGIRDKVQEAFNRGQTFTGEKAKRYDICCTYPNLTDHPDFPNVSKHQRNHLQVGYG